MIKLLKNFGTFLRNIIGTVFFLVAAVPFFAAAFLITPDLRRKITLKVLEFHDADKKPESK